MRDYWAKPLDKEKALKHSITWKLGKPWGKALKAKGGTHAPKPIVYQGHPWAVSGFGEKRAIPFSARRVAGGGERKPPLIAHWQSSKSAVPKEWMSSDLGAPDLTVEIAPDGGTGFDRGFNHGRKNFDHQVGGWLIPRCNWKTEPTKKRWRSSQEDKWPLPVSRWWWCRDREPQASISKWSDRGRREASSHEIDWL